MVSGFDKVRLVISTNITRASAGLVVPSRHVLERPTPSAPSKLVRDIAGEDFGLIIGNSPAGDVTASGSAEHAFRSAGFQRLDPFRDRLDRAVIEPRAPRAAAARSGRSRSRGLK